MSERWAECRPCAGTGRVRDSILLTTQDCGRCEGTGIDGSADSWSIRERTTEHDKEDFEGELRKQRDKSRRDE